MLQNEDTSCESFEFPWNIKNRKDTSVILVESQAQEQHVTVNLVICLGAVFLFGSGVLLIGVSIWSVVKKIQYYYLLDIRVDVPYFTIPAGVLCLPSFWIAASIHNNIERQQFLPLLILLMLATAALVLTGSRLGMVFAKRDPQSNSTQFYSTIDDGVLNETLRFTIVQYKENPLYHFAWDKMQSQLKCCGILNYRDWFQSALDLPDACCLMPICNATNAFKRGCLVAMSRDLVWDQNFMTGHCYMVAVIQLNFIIIAIAIYCSKRLENN